MALPKLSAHALLQVCTRESTQSVNVKWAIEQLHMYHMFCFLSKHVQSLPAIYLVGTNSRSHESHVPRFSYQLQAVKLHTCVYKLRACAVISILQEEG